MGGLITLGIILFSLLGLIIYTIIIYNGFVALKNNIDQNWSNIDVLPQQRYDELPKLIKVCEGYMQHEQKTLEAVVKARSMVIQPGAKTKTSGQNALPDPLNRCSGSLNPILI